MRAAIDRMRRYVVAWEAVYSALRERRYGRQPMPLVSSLRRATAQAWTRTAHGGVLRRLRDDDVIGQASSPPQKGEDR